MEQNSVLLDTSFFIRLLNEEDPLHNNALGYFRYFLEHDFVIKISTIAIAEYCVKGEVSELPLKNMLIVPFQFRSCSTVRKDDCRGLCREEKARCYHCSKGCCA